MGILLQMLMKLMFDSSVILFIQNCAFSLWDYVKHVTLDIKDVQSMWTKYPELFNVNEEQLPVNANEFAFGTQTELISC